MAEQDDPTDDLLAGSDVIDAADTNASTARAR